MAQWSAYGVSGWDPVTSFGEGLMQSYFNQKAAAKSAKRQYKYAKRYAEWSALHGPSLQVQGLLDAGLNPILAANPGGGNMPQLGVSGEQAPGLGGSVSGYDPEVNSALKIQKKQAELLDVQLDIANQEYRQVKASADIAENDVGTKRSEQFNAWIDASARQAAITGVSNEDVIKFLDKYNAGDEYNRLVELYRNQIESGAYKNSMGHAIYEDITSGVHSAAEAVNSVNAVRRANFENKNARDRGKLEQRRTHGNGKRVYR